MVASVLAWNVAILGVRWNLTVERLLFKFSIDCLKFTRCVLVLYNADSWRFHALLRRCPALVEIGLGAVLVFYFLLVDLDGPKHSGGEYTFLLMWT
jgi:hypothetical protein